MPVWMIFRSVPQMPHARTRTSTSSSPGTGTGRSSTSNRCGAISTVAFIVRGICMPSLLYIFGLYTSRAMGRTTLARKNLLAWQWSDYPSRHQDAGNLMLHIVVVPLFQVATLVLAYGVVT